MNIGAGKNFNWNSFSQEVQDAIKPGIADAWDDFGAVMKKVETGEIGSGDAFGSNSTALLVKERGIGRHLGITAT